MAVRVAREGEESDFMGSVARLENESRKQESSSASDVSTKKACA